MKLNMLAHSAFAFALASVPFLALAAAPMPGSIAGGGLTFTITEGPEGGSEVYHPNVQPPAGTFWESGGLLLCEPGTTLADCTNSWNNPPTSGNSPLWSDLIVWSGGNLIDFYSDPAAFPTGNFGQGTEFGIEVLFPGGGDGYTYLAKDANGNVTTWNIISDIPEPETYAMMLAGLGLLGFMARRRIQKAA